MDGIADTGSLKYVLDRYSAQKVVSKRSMNYQMSLKTKLMSWQSEMPDQPEILDLLVRLSDAAEKLAIVLSGEGDGEDCENLQTNASGDVQTVQDKKAHNLFVESLVQSPFVRSLVSEESALPLKLGSGRYSVGIDPFDGSRAFRFGIPPGTIFAIYEDSTAVEDYCGSHVVCAGFFLYSHKLEMYVALDEKVFLIDEFGTHQYANLGCSDRFVCANLSNLRIWPTGWANFFRRVILGELSDQTFNMRWFGSLATHAKTVILSGGLFGYPPDAREGYGAGHLRLIYEAIPISFLINSLGGESTDGNERILNIKPKDYHQKTPFAFGEADLVSQLREEIQKSLELQC